VESLVLPLLDEMTEKRPGYNSVARGYVLQLCGLIERELSGGVSSHADERGLSHTLERIQAAIDYIYEKAEYPISLHDVAEVASLSPWYFSRVFKKTIGTSFRIFVNEVRIERAESLMADGTKTLAEIALESGFDNLRTFNEVFRAIRGTTPSQSRAGMGCGPRIPEHGLKTDPTHFPQFHNVSKGEAPAHIGT
jgi:AraC-like DNA-binding protein